MSDFQYEAAESEGGAELINDSVNKRVAVVVDTAQEEIVYPFLNIGIECGGQKAQNKT